MKKNIKIWSEEEVNFILHNYSKKGLKECSLKLSRPIESVRKKIEQLRKQGFNIKYEGTKNKHDITIEKLIEIVNLSNSLSDVCKIIYNNNFHGNRNTLKNIINKNNINTSHFYKNKTQIKRMIPLEEILILNSNYTDTNSLKKRLYNAGLKKEECELCTQGPVWLGKKMSLIIDHINGDNKDNRLQNLQIVCPNCAATLPTHCRGINKMKKIK